MSSTIEVGDVVRLRTGNAPIRVTHTSPNKVSGKYIESRYYVYSRPRTDFIIVSKEKKNMEERLYLWVGCRKHTFDSQTPFTYGLVKNLKEIPESVDNLRVFLVEKELKPVITWE